MAAKMRITHERLLEVLEYDPLSGVFTWKVKKGKSKVGKIAGSKNKIHGYVEIGFGGLVYRAHILAFFYMTGRWPKAEIDHIDLDRSNNRWSNIREATHSENARNKSVRRDSASGLKGAFLREYGRYASKIRVGDQMICLGTFDTAEEAHAAYCAAAKKYHRDFARVQ